MYGVMRGSNVGQRQNLSRLGGVLLDQLMDGNALELFVYYEKTENCDTINPTLRSVYHGRELRFHWSVGTMRA